MVRISTVCFIAGALAVFVLSFVGWASAASMSHIEAIKECRAELGDKGKYLQVRKCVLKKLKGDQ
jgi:hypothetical protein